MAATVGEGNDVNATATDGRGLVQTIIERPDDPVARAVLCDWLTDVGDAVALDWLELIRSGREIQAGNRENYERFDGLYCVWVAESYLPLPLWEAARLMLSGLRLPLPSRLVIRRGFVDEISCNLSAWKSRGVAVVREHPITAVRALDKCPDYEEDARYHWYFYDPADEADSVPTWLRPEGAVRIDEATFETDADAREWLSRRLVRWARKEAGFVD